MDRPDVRWTSAALVSGTLLSVACLLVGLFLNLAGGESQTEDPRRLDFVFRSALELQPWGWSMLGVLLLLGTPAAALVATALEVRGAQPRTALLALVVLAILAAAAIGALAG